MMDLRLRGLRDRLAAALPTWGVALSGGLLWALAMGGSAALTLVTDGWRLDDSICEVAVLFAIGGFIGFPIGLTLASLLAAGRHRQARFASLMLALPAATIAVTTTGYALQYRLYYAQWHAELLSITWAFQFIFTTLGATFQFAVSGLRLYFPLGFLALLATAFWFARRAR